MIVRWALLTTAFVAGVVSLARATGENDSTMQQAAVVAAVERVAPSVVQIETIGGLERTGAEALAEGPTTGLIVDPAGFIVTSSFRFADRPTSILVRLPGGARKPARIVAEDHARMLVLLKIDPDGPLPVCEAAPTSEMRVGQWAIAVGRAFDAAQPNLAVGVLSARNRVWGRAIQTDAAVSPNNYGGPLVDIRGRVLGVLVPLSPDSSSEMAGVEWYDSGIGFAIPMEHIQKMLPRLMAGEDLRPGVLGLSLRGPNQYTGEPTIAAVRPNSPAEAGGLKPGDRIVAIDGRPVRRAADLRQELGSRYAGDAMRVSIQREKQSSDHDVTLAAKLEPFQHGFFGILPMRATDAGGVAVRYVYPESPAAAAGIAPGDVIPSLDGEAIATAGELALKLGAKQPGKSVELGVRRDGNVRNVTITLAAMPETLPPQELPSAHEPVAATDAQRPKVGAIAMKIPEFPNDVQAYVPEQYTAATPYGVVLWLHPPGGYDWQQVLTRWKPLCDRYDLILIAPKANDTARWSPAEAALVDRLLIEAAATYNVDPARVVVHGHEGGGLLAFYAAFHNLEGIRAVAAVEAPPVGDPPENDPLRRLDIFLASSPKSRLARQIEAGLAACRKERIPVTTKGLGETPRDLNEEELAELARWIDMLDRI